MAVAFVLLTGLALLRSGTWMPSERLLFLSGYSPPTSIEALQEGLKPGVDRETVRRQLGRPWHIVRWGGSMEEWRYWLEIFTEKADVRPVEVQLELSFTNGLLEAWYLQRHRPNMD